MIFNSEEKRLLTLYKADTREETIDVLWEALPYIDEPETRTVVDNLIKKLGVMSRAEFERVIII